VFSAASFVTVFEFYRLRVHFEALGSIIFPPGGSSDLIRGALGECLRRLGPEAGRLFRPSAARPSGLKLPPRPFVLRTLPLDGRAVKSDEPFSFDLHVFEQRVPVLDYFRQAFEMMAAEGVGPGRSPLRLMGVETLDLEGNPRAGGFRCAARLDSQGEAVRAATLRFLTPTELKAQGRVIEEPEFRHLFARIRDRIAMLCELYGPGPLSFDFQALSERAAGVALERSDLTWEYAARKSKGTGKIHPLGGFTGTAEYRGTLGPFLPWLRAAQWAGVGRQTVWGKGDVRVVGTEQDPSRDRPLPDGRGSETPTTERP
jgi:CRISPR-associated endoribonuclease Cas6